MAKNNKQLIENSLRGMSLLEVLLAVAIFAIGIGTVTHLYLGSHYAAAHSAEKNQAVIWAKEGIEAVRSIRDGDIDALGKIGALGGVAIYKETGELLGYAWSANMGWISFEESDVEVEDCPDYPGCIATLNESDEISGWVKTLTNDEWISFRGTTGVGEYGVDVVEDDLHGWAWGDDNFGWISFNCENKNECGTSDYKVQIKEGDEVYDSVEGWAWSDNIGWIHFPFGLQDEGEARGITVKDSKWMLVGDENIESKFTREVSIMEIDEETWEVVVTVSWQPLRGSEDSVSLSERLTSWREEYNIEYNLNISSLAGGTVDTPEEGDFTHYYGDKIDIVAEADEGYIFSGWTGDTDEIDNVSLVETFITMPDEDVNIVAEFTEEGE